MEDVSGLSLFFLEFNIQKLLPVFLILSTVCIIPALGAVNLTPPTVTEGENLTLNITSLANGSVVNLTISSSDLYPTSGLLSYQLDDFDMPFNLTGGSLTISGSNLNWINVSMKKDSDFYTINKTGSGTVSETVTRDFDSGIYEYIRLQGGVNNTGQPCTISLTISGTKDGLDDSTRNFTVHGASSGNITFVVTIDGSEEMNETIRIIDTTPPGPVTSLHVTDRTTSNITWAWTNPIDPDFNHVEVYLDSAFKTDLLSPNNTYTAFSLEAGTSHNLTLRTVDNSGNPAANTSSTNSTIGASVSLTPDTVTEGENLTLAITNLVNGSLVNLTISSTDLHPTSSLLTYQLDNFDMPFALNNGTLTVNGTNLIWVNLSITKGSTITVERYENPFGSGNVSVSESRDIESGLYTSIHLSGSIRDSDSPCSISLSFNGTKDGDDNTTRNFTVQGASSGNISFLMRVNSTVPLNKTIQVTETHPDITPPAPVTNLQNTGATSSSLIWEWTNPPDPDFSHVIVYLNDAWKANLTAPTSVYVASGLTRSTTYTLRIRTVDTSGNANINSSSSAATLSEGGGGGGGPGAAAGGFVFPSEGASLPAEWYSCCIKGALFDVTADGNQTILIHLPTAGDSVTLASNGLISKNKILEIRVETFDPPVKDNINVTGTVKRVTIRTDPITGEIKDIGGKFLVSFETTYPTAPPCNSGIKVTLAEAPKDDLLYNFQIGAYRQGLEINQFAYTMNVRTLNVSPNNPVNLTFSISPEWVGMAGGMNAVRIMRVTDEGNGNILETVSAGYDQYGNYLYKAYSPEGFSTFGLVTLRQASVIPPLPSPETVAPITTLTRTPAPVTATPTTTLAQVTVEETPPIFIFAAIGVLILAVVANIFFLGRR
jgi:hypothetical protein